MHKQPHYLRSCRRRASLSQRDVAILLGVRAVSKISRYERQVTLPPIKTALAYQIIFGRPVAVLFRGAYEVIRVDIRRRASKLAQSPLEVRSSIRDARRRESLQSILRR